MSLKVPRPSKTEDRDIISNSKAWEWIGYVIMLFYIVEAANIVTFSSTHPIMDIYFFVDVSFRLVRMNTETYDENGNIITTERYKGTWLRIWLICDILLSIPYGSILHLFFSRPVVKLVEIKERKSALLHFIVNKDFRRSIVANFKNHFAERKLFRHLWSMVSAPTVYRYSWRAVLHRTYRILGFGFRMAKKLKLLTYYYYVSRVVASILMTLRTLSKLMRSVCYTTKTGD